MHINENFIVEQLSDKKFFLSNKENGTGYYVVSKRDIRSTEILENTPEVLHKINYITDQLPLPVEEKWINRFIKFANPYNERSLLTTLLLTFFVSIALLVYMTIQGDFFQKTVAFSPGKTVLAVGVFLLGVTFIHEVLHIIVARMQDIYIFKYGMKFKYYFIPILYVRILPTGNNIKRSNVAFAGNVADLFLLIIYITLFYLTGNDLFIQVFYFQMIMLFFNYNPLFPTDFYIFLFSLLRKSDFRYRSILYTKYTFKISKKIDAKTLSKDTRTKAFYLLYGLAFCLMIAMFFATFAFNIYMLLGGM